MVDAYGLCAKASTFVNIMYICKLMKNPQPDMSMQQKMRWGHDFPKDKGREC